MRSDPSNSLSAKLSEHLNNVLFGLVPRVGFNDLRRTNSMSSLVPRDLPRTKTTGMSLIADPGFYLQEVLATKGHFSDHDLLQFTMATDSAPNSTSYSNEVPTVKQRLTIATTEVCHNVRIHSSFD